MSRQIAILSTIALSLTLPSWAGQVYSREDAVKIALEKSSDIQSAEEEVKTANSQVEAGYGNAYPTVDFSATYARTFGVKDVRESSALTDALNSMSEGDSVEKPSQYDYAIAGATDGVLSGLSAMNGYRWGTQVGLTANQVLYAQGKISTGIQIAKAYKRIAEASLEDTKAKVRYDVENAFNQLIFLDSSVVITEESIDLTQSYVDLAVKAHESGTGTELDVIRAQIQLDEGLSGLEKLKKKRVIARNALLNSMGLPFEADVSFKGELANPDNDSTVADTSMANVKKRRKELVMLEETENMKNLNIDIEEGSYKPTLVLGGSVTYQSGKNRVFRWAAPDWDKNISKKVYLNFSMNLFNGFQTREKVSQAKISLRETQIQKETAERGFRLQIESCLNDLDDAQKQLIIKKRSVDLAQKNQEMTDAAFKVGRDTQINLLNANMSLHKAKLDYMEAILNWNNAKNALLQATGEY